jgi:hypothetical protein
LPNIVIVTQFWLGRGPVVVVEPDGERLERWFVDTGWPPTSCVTE